MVKIEYAATSAVGKVRSNNEDNFFANGKTLSEGLVKNEKFSNGCVDVNANDPNGEDVNDPNYVNVNDLNDEDVVSVCGCAVETGLFAVCDGMGGAAHGELASEVAVQALEKYFKQIQQDNSFDKLCSSYIDDANTKICREIEKRGGVSIGTTLVLLSISNTKAQICNIGDSRIYRIRGGKMSQLSIDHTQMRLLIEIGTLTPEKARSHPDRHVLTQHLGIFPKDMVIKPYLPKAFNVKDGDMFLLCSDGLTEVLEDSEIQGLVIQGQTQNQTAVEIANNLTTAALQEGGKDNVTVIIVKLDIEKKGLLKRLLKPFYLRRF